MSSKPRRVVIEELDSDDDTHHHSHSHSHQHHHARHGSSSTTSVPIIEDPDDIQDSQYRGGNTSSSRQNCAYDNGQHRHQHQYQHQHQHQPYRQQANSGPDEHHRRSHRGGGLFGGGIDPFASDPFFGGHHSMMQSFGSTMGSSFFDHDPFFGSRGMNDMFGGMMPRMSDMINGMGNPHGGGRGAGNTNTVYYSSSSTTTSSNGVSETTSKVYDSREGGATRVSVKRRLADKTHAIERTIDPTGREQTIQSLENIRPEEQDQFDREWQEKSRSLPRWSRSPADELLGPGSSSAASWNNRIDTGHRRLAIDAPTTRHKSSSRSKQQQQQQQQQQQRSNDRI